MSDRMNLCLNCLEPGAKGIQIGPDKGTQRDPWRESVQLCPECEKALLEGHFWTLSRRFKMSREIIREES